MEQQWKIYIEQLWARGGQEWPLGANVKPHISYLWPLTPKPTHGDHGGVTLSSLIARVGKFVHGCSSGYLQEATNPVLRWVCRSGGSVVSRCWLAAQHEIP